LIIIFSVLLLHRLSKMPILSFKSLFTSNIDSQQWNNSMIIRAKMARKNHVAYRNAYKILIHNLELFSSG